MKIVLTAAGECVFLPLPDEMLQRLGLKEGDVVEVDEQPAGSRYFKITGTKS